MVEYMTYVFYILGSYILTVAEKPAVEGMFTTSHTGHNLILTSSTLQSRRIPDVEKFFKISETSVTKCSFM